MAPLKVAVVADVLLTPMGGVACAVAGVETATVNAVTIASVAPLAVVVRVRS